MTRVLGALACALVGAGCLIDVPPERELQPHDAGRQPCVVAPTELEFGEVATGGEGVKVLSLGNPSSKQLLVSLTQVDEPFSLTSLLIAVPASNSARIPITFRPRDGLTHIARTTITSEGCEPRDVELRGTGQGDVLVPQSIAIGPTPLGGLREIPVRVINTRREALTLTVSVVGQPDAVAFSFPAQLTVQPSSTAELPVQFRSATPGTFQLSLAFSAGQLSRECTITAKAGFPVARVERSRIVFDPIPATRETTQRVFHVFNDGPVALSLSPPRVTLGESALPGELLASAPLSVPPGQFGDVTVQLTPQHGGAGAWSVEVDTDDPLQPTLHFVVSANIALVAACSSAAVVAMPFQADVSGPWPQALPVQFTNASSGPCLVRDVHFTPLSTWALDLGDADGFLIPAMSTRSQIITITQAGQHALVFGTYPGGSASIVVRATD